MALAVALSPSVASAQISSATSTNTGSTCDQAADPQNGYCGSSVSVPTNDGTTFSSRYAWNINSDVPSGAQGITGAAQHDMAFAVTAVGGYRLDVTTALVGDLNRRQDQTFCSGRADISAVTGVSNVALASGSLDLADPGETPSGGNTTSVPINLGGSAVIYGESNGTPVSHTLSFTWDGIARSAYCATAVRVG